ncbi:MAG TPA: hypothetical protein VEG60_32070 [Candidatus Binatia bacterium]|nr:hypothetical protein [Candidatus Binatia bacterium]
MAVAAGRVDIPDGLDPRFQPEIEKYLNQALDELRKMGAKRVTSRLNYSNTEKAIPCWGGTVEDQSIQLLRRFDAGRVRFGQSNRSKVYEQAVTDDKGQIHERDWGQKLPEKSEDGYGPGQALGPKAGCRYQLFIALRIKHDSGFQHVGSLTVAFEKEPDKNAVGPVMQKWATDGSPYVEYLKNTFNLGGPNR